MKRTTLILTVIFISISIHAQKVVYDMDKSVDFSQFKTFEFLGWQDDTGNLLNDMDKKRLQTSFTSEFDARKLERTDGEADMAISIYVVVSQEKSVTAYTNFHTNTGYRYRRSWGWSSGYATTSYSEKDYLEGTIVVDVFDGESKELIWQGVVSGTIKAKPEKREKSIPKVVAKLMKKFPVEVVK